jgi:AcrR family transcriptional regulator
MAGVTGGGRGGRHRRNARGQGGRLREEIVAAAAAMVAESGGSGQLTLRGVAKRVGIAATSIYPHFPDVEHLAIAVAEQRFAELARRQDAFEEELSDPGEILLARCRAYCHFAMENPTHYRIMFFTDLGPTMTFGFDEAPGRASFEALVGAIKRCQVAGTVAPDRDPFRLAVEVWSAEHGLVSLRLTRRRFPWPPLDELVDETVARLVGLDQGAHRAKGSGHD